MNAITCPIAPNIAPSIVYVVTRPKLYAKWDRVSSTQEYVLLILADEYATTIPPHIPIQCPMLPKNAILKISIKSIFSIYLVLPSKYNKKSIVLFC
ncbi:hypothetical protein MNB_SV-9-1257 [hydrothermal vent metagenome]|uniref:Uncharacterized protein n=1 Tax=hydrothermal vent metagenome TaxID=652676 RepID=A0A1W1BJL7_9ZZZZ